MKEVSVSQIERLYRFTREHYVEYYDVQTELVDHLANGIEAQWKESPGMSFEDALQREFKKFGVYGFSNVVEKRERAMEKKYFKLILKEISALLKEISVILPISLLLFGCFFVLKLDRGLNYITYEIFTYYLVLIVSSFRRSYSLKKKKRTGKKIFLLEAVIFNTGCYFSFFWIPFQLIHSILDSGKVENVYIQFALAVLFTLLVVTSYICFYHLPKKKDEILQKVHPEIKYLQ